MSSDRTKKEQQESIDWMRSRPDSIKSLMLRFPPSCTVRAKILLRVPAPGDTGTVSSYVEPEDEIPSGLLGVVGFDHAFGDLVRARCRPEWLEVLDYYQNDHTGEIQDEQWVRKILGGS